MPDRPAPQDVHHHHDDMEQLTRADFDALPLSDIEDRTGLEAPDDPADEADYRERAWRSYKVDIAHRDEWGTAREGTVPPAEGEEPEY